MKLLHICSLLAVVCSTAVQAESYVIGVEKLAFAPHYSVDAQGQYQGFARDLFDLFAQKSGIELSYKVLPVEQLLPALLAGQVDLKYPDSETWAQAQKTGKSLSYSQGVVEYVDGVLVAPQRLGLPVEQVKRLAMVNGWTPWGYQERIDGGQIELTYSDDLRQMIRQALRKDTDGAYFNVVVATHYLDNIRARPGALIFDPTLPHNRGSFKLSTIKQTQLMQRFDRFLIEYQAEIAALKQQYRVEANLDPEHIGLEQWKLDFLERKKFKEAQSQ
ncbi:transporter substrate-binding domain-containing protein [Pseudomonas sp. SL4(2022)]|uniref:substrate-binding periplasmic protein n=1 Tax=Pseudomonas sp. SL4(2022) TaxID=2994661 RepID=UPI0022710C1A|nr:transporter substrate-binding domain-containing protein [Pseudomonas sp. SL4(2022)]WAC44013.1 transporter substrate-binding domain-containing protein [Pseudomonas sp. SL4(2022)]